MGKLIVIEGACDGIGKTTQFELLKTKLNNLGYNVVSHHFPSYGEYQGSSVEHYLKGEYGSPSTLSPYFINNLYAIDRAVTWNTKLKKEYENNIILLDRYTTSSLIYQSVFIDNIEEKKKFINFVIDFEYKKLGIKEPDLVIFLDAPYELVTFMRKNRNQNDGVKNDVYEKDTILMKKIYENAKFVSKYLNFSIVNCSKNNQMKSIDEIHNQIYKLVKKNIEKN